MSRSNPEDMRVKFPALAHLTRLGYAYLCNHQLAGSHPIFENPINIVVGVLRESLIRINERPVSESDFEEIMSAILIMLDSEDLGEKYTQALRNGINGWKLIDFNNLKNNILHVATEVSVLDQKGATPYDTDRFRPDIMVFVNGLPISFIEVKRENNLAGVQAEQDRMNERSLHPGYRSFLNMMQFVAFTNNMEYNDGESIPRSGGFYAAINPGKQYLNHMRDEEDRKAAAQKLPPVDKDVLQKILYDNNVVEIQADKAFINRLDPTTPANSFLTSLYRPDRLFFLLKYGVAYRKTRQAGGLVRKEKHVMRYPQIFATKAIERYLGSGHTRGVIWHTQGSGKTALAYFNVKYLTDYYQHKNTVAQFFFVVDRLDLAQQAKAEFEARGLEVTLARSRDDFTRIVSNVAPPSSSGKQQITVVNIQKFSEDSTIQDFSYAANVQRVYFVDEAHRSYDPQGSFLANLLTSDRNAVIIALTGTPLLKKDKATKEVFGPYIHTYYYNQSIADGYTLRLMRERIIPSYKNKLNKALKDAQIEVGAVTLKQVKEHPNYIKALAEYVADDLQQARTRLSDKTIGGMVVCCSTKQARMLHNQLSSTCPELNFGLVLHDEGDKVTREDIVSNFKSGSIDLLIVFNMLLTGFDAPRLKRLYLERLVAKHNLLQTLTRVNRPYGKHEFGSVIDFADISEEFDKTNQAYMKELQEQLGHEWDEYTKVLITEKEVAKAVNEIKDVLWEYDLSNVSVFIDEINAIEDREEINRLKKALIRYLALYNQVRLQSDDNLFAYFDIDNARCVLNETKFRAATLASMQAAQKGDYSALIELGLDVTEFRFEKLDVTELQVADKFMEALKRFHKERDRNLDPKDPVYNGVLEEIEKLLKRKKFVELDAQEFEERIHEIEKYRERIRQINEANIRLVNKYRGDDKFMRIHKRVQERPNQIASNSRLVKLLEYVKTSIDDTVSNNENLLNNSAFFEREVQRSIVQACKQPAEIDCDSSCIIYLAKVVSNEYIANVRRSA